jgi:hypothetical protein
MMRYWLLTRRYNDRTYRLSHADARTPIRLCWSAWPTASIKNDDDFKTTLAFLSGHGDNCLLLWAFPDNVPNGS